MYTSTEGGGLTSSGITAREWEGEREEEEERKRNRQRYCNRPSSKFIRWLTSSPPGPSHADAAAIVVAAGVVVGAAFEGI